MGQANSGHSLRAGQSGFTLAEVLVATAIAATLSVAILGLFSGGVRSWQRVSRTPRQGEVQRALLVLSSDLRQASAAKAERGSLVLRLAKGVRVRYRVVAENDQDWFVREVFTRHGRWSWEPKRPLFRAARKGLELRAENVSGKEQVTLKAGQTEWRLRVVLRGRM